MTTQKSWRRRTRNQSIFLVLLLLFFGGVYYFLQQQTLAENHVGAHFQKPNGSKTSALQLELADSFPEREAGLMFRKEMPAGNGMLFVFPESKIQSFWMKNTYLSLDIIFINEDKKVVGILKNVPPLNTEPRSVGIPSKYVVELVAGESERLNISVGETLLLEKNVFPPGD